MFASPVIDFVDRAGFPGTNPRHLRSGPIVRSVRRAHPTLGRGRGVTSEVVEDLQGPV